MESVETEIVPLAHSPDFKVRHIIYTRVQNIKPCLEGDWIHFEGSRESMLFPTRSYAVGDEMKITFEKVSNALPR